MAHYVRVIPNQNAHPSCKNISYFETKPVDMNLVDINLKGTIGSMMGVKSSNEALKKYVKELSESLGIFVCDINKKSEIFVKDFNQYVNEYNKSTKTQNQYAAFGYILAGLAAFVSFSIEFMSVIKVERRL